MRGFKDLIGETILVGTGKDTLEEMTIMGVEGGGIWFTSKTWSHTLMERIGVAAIEKQPIFFLPYSQITFAMQTEKGGEGPLVTVL